MTVSPIQDAVKASNYFQGRAGHQPPGEYYLTAEGKGEPAGQWHDAESLGLAGIINGADLQRILEGQDPKGKEMLVQSGKGHRPGWDCTFSAPKSVSAIWAVAPQKLRQQIEDAHHKAVAETKKYLDERAAFTRRGKGGAEREAVKLIAAEYRHSTNRNDEPHLHSHLLVMNVAKRLDGSWGTIESKHIMQHQMAAGTIYQLSMASQLEKMGFGIQAGKGGTFQVAGVPEVVIKQWSKRHEEIAEKLDEAGITKSRGKGAEIAFHETRRSKSYTDPSLLRKQWLDQAKALGWTPEVAQALMHREYGGAHALDLKPPRWKDMDSEKSLIRELGARMYGRATAAEVRDMAEQITMDWRAGQDVGRELATTASRIKPAEKPPALRLDESTRRELRTRLAGLGRNIPQQAPGERLPDAAWQQARDTAAWLIQSSPVLIAAVNQSMAAAVATGRDPRDAQRYVEARLAGTLTKLSQGVAQQERRAEILDLAVGPDWKGCLNAPTAEAVRQAVGSLRALPRSARGQAAVEATRIILADPAVRPLVEDYTSRETDQSKAEEKLVGRVASGLVAAADYADRRSDAQVSRTLSAVLVGLLQTARQEELAAERLAREEEAARAKRRQMESLLDR